MKTYEDFVVNGKFTLPADKDLSGANLRGAALRGADLRGANLRGAKGICVFGAMPSSGRMVYAVKHESCIMFQAGCFWGSQAELEECLKSELEGGEKSQTHFNAYMAGIAFAVAVLEIEHD